MQTLRKLPIMIPYRKIIKQMISSGFMGRLLFTTSNKSKILFDVVEIDYL
jgi:hypothetical protein